MACADKTISMSKAEWLNLLEARHVQRSDMDGLIMNYLVTEGFKEAAQKFQVESGIEPPVNLDTMDDRIKIRDSVQKGEIEEAITLINDLHPVLLDDNRNLYFHLQQLQLIELIRNGKVEEALLFAQNRLSEAGENNPLILNELERTLALLAFEEPEKSPFNDLLNFSHRNKVASEVNSAILKMEHNKEPTPKLYNLMMLILWAQDELDQKKVKYPHMTDIATASLDSPK